MDDHHDNLPARRDSWPNSAIRAIAAGLSLGELRAMLRGEPPTERPNPRYRAHKSSMLLHMRPRTYPAASTWFTHTFRLGFLAVFLFVVEVISGLVLMVYYVPRPDGAYESIYRIMHSAPFGEHLRDVHRLAAELMIVVVALHMLRTFLTGSFKNERKFTWITGVALLILTLGLTFSGYLLPWDQLAYWAVTIGTSMAGAAPVIGEQLNIVLRGSTEIGADGLLRFYLLHIIGLPLIAALLLAVHYYRVARIHGISLPAWVEEKDDVPEEVRIEARRPIDFLPRLLGHEVLWTIIGILFLFVAVYWFYDAPLERHANPLRTPLESEAPWFFLWVQGLLKLGDKLWFGIAIPAAFFVLLFLVPCLDSGQRRMLRHRPLSLVAVVVVLAALVVLTYMGTPRYGLAPQPAAHIGQVLAPEEGVGPLRQVPFDQLKIGYYETNKTPPAELPEELARVFSVYEQMVREAVDKGDLPDAKAWMIVEDRQADLKRVTLRIQWTDPEPEAEGETARKTHERTVYIHRSRHGALGATPVAGVEAPQPSGPATTAALTPAATAPMSPTRALETGGVSPR